MLLDHVGERERSPRKVILMSSRFRTFFLSSWLSSPAPNLEQTVC